MATEITTEELKDAYRRSGLWRHGVSFAKAVSQESTLRSMRHQVEFHRDLHAHRGPIQQTLPLEAK